jgi:hypothetical protein
MADNEREGGGTEGGSQVPTYRSGDSAGARIRDAFRGGPRRRVEQGMTGGGSSGAPAAPKGTTPGEENKLIQSESKAAPGLMPRARVPRKAGGGRRTRPLGRRR